MYKIHTLHNTTLQKKQQTLKNQNSFIELMRFLEFSANFSDILWTRFGDETLLYKNEVFSEVFVHRFKFT